MENYCIILRGNYRLTRGINFKLILAKKIYTNLTFTTFIIQNTNLTKTTRTHQNRMRTREQVIQLIIYPTDCEVVNKYTEPKRLHVTAKVKDSPPLICTQNVIHAYTHACTHTNT